MTLSSLRRRPAALGAVALSMTVAVALVPGLLSAPAYAARQVSESYPVPAGGAFQVTGHGYGHGHGMSQYGARGAAKAGLGYRQILAFYYPGTTLTTAGGTIRVLITADNDQDVQVFPASGLRVREVRSGVSHVLPVPRGIRTWRLRTVKGATVLDYYDGAWRTVTPGGKRLNGAAEFHRPGVVSLRLGAGTRNYRGALRLSSSRTVNVLDLDDYVRGVVPREMPASWEAAAVEAQAVAARSYAARDRADNVARHYQTCDTTACQVYGGVGAEDARSNAAVRSTAHRILSYQGRPAFTQFSSSSGGWLSRGSVPYLVAKADPYDGHSQNPMHTWTTTLTRVTIQRAYPSLGTLKRVVVTRRDGNGDWHGRVEQLVLIGTRSKITVSGNTFRSRFALRSNWFRFGASGSSGPAVASKPAAPALKVSTITAHWRALGGYHSSLGGPTSREYVLGAGHARNFQHGRIYAKAGLGTHALQGRILRVYLRKGAAGSRLGFPRTSPTKFGRGRLAHFEKGTIRVFRSGRVTVSYRR